MQRCIRRLFWIDAESKHDQNSRRSLLCTELAESRNCAQYSYGAAPVAHMVELIALVVLEFVAPGVSGSQRSELQEAGVAMRSHSARLPAVVPGCALRGGVVALCVCVHLPGFL